MRQIKIFDTTLRDGEQSPGCSMDIAEKLEFAAQLERLKVDIIEAGFAIASAGDFESVRSIAELVKNCTVASLARTTTGDIKSAWDAVRFANSPRIHTFIATSDIHMKYKLKMSPEEVLLRTYDMVKYAKSLCDDIEFSAEDASRSDKEFLKAVYERAICAGATTLNVPDTVGYSTPQEMYMLIDYLKNNVQGIENVDISVHCHNDLGLALANSFSAVNAGATQVECTVNGIGERAGNAAMDEFVMGLLTRKDYYNATCNVDASQIYRTSKILSSIIGMPIPNNKPIVGNNAFAHESGIHQHGVLSDRSTYEIMTPADIGIPSNKMVLGKHSGRHAFEDRLKELGYSFDSEKLNATFEKFKQLADRKKTVTDDDIIAIIGSDIVTQGGFEYVSFLVNTGSSISSTATVILKKEDVEFEEVAIGHGPIDAAYKAIDKITSKNCTMENYSIRSVTEGEDALGEVVVKLKSNGEILTGRGVSTDIIEASIKAYLNGINKIMS